MQRIAQRAQRVKRVAARKVERAEKNMKEAEAWERNQRWIRLGRNNAELFRTARRNRVEDWETGRLRPRRDVGNKTDTYGAINVWDAGVPDEAEENRLLWWPIVEGDRVVVTQGREKGRIGTVTSRETNTNMLVVTDINLLDMVIPDWMERGEGDTAPIVAQPQPIPFSHVKLVYPLRDPETGLFRDVVIDRLVRVNPVFDRKLRKWTEGDRAIPGTKMMIPWPKKIEETKNRRASDTPGRARVRKSFQPALQTTPMPSSVIDELRNKYSLFRDRHDHEYVQAKQAQDEREMRRKDLGKTMRLPLQELKDVRAERKAAEEASGKKELSQEQLAKIGEVIERERLKAKEAARASEEAV